MLYSLHACMHSRNLPVIVWTLLIKMNQLESALTKNNLLHAKNRLLVLLCVLCCEVLIN